MGRTFWRVGTAAAAMCVAAAVVYAAAGDLDATFGTGGIVRDANGGQECLVVVPQSNGGVLGAGRTTSGQWLLARYDAAGARDATFGSGGSRALFGANGGDMVADAADDGTGRTLAVGTVQVPFTSGKGRNMTTTWVPFATVARVDASGNLDATFGSSGSVQIAIPGAYSSRGVCVATQTDGKIVVTGDAVFVVKSHGPSTYAYASFVARLNTDGSFDSAFGNGGIAQGAAAPYRVSAEPHSLGLQSDGRIVVLVREESTPVVSRVVRYTSSGIADTTFASSAATAPDFLYRIAVDSADRIVAVGSRTQTASNFDALATRFAADGGIDASFAGGAGATVDLSASDGAVCGVVIDASDRPIFTVTSHPSTNVQSLTTTRLNSDGSIDTSFGSNGLTQSITLGTLTNGYGNGLAADGRIYLCGMVSTSIPNGFLREWLIARYDAN